MWLNNLRLDMIL